MGKRKRKNVPFMGKRPRKGPRKTILDLPNDVLGIILEYLDDPADYRNLSLVGKFKPDADRHVWHNLSLDLSRSHYQERITKTWKRKGYLDHVRTLNFVLPEVPAPQRAFKQLLKLMPENELRSVTFTPVSRIRKDSLELYLEFLLSRPTISKAVIPEVYYRGDQLDDESHARSHVSFRCEYDRSHLRELYFLDQNSTAAFQHIYAKLRDKPEVIDIWGYRKGRSPPPSLQNHAMTLLFKHLHEVRALRFSGIQLQKPGLMLGKFMSHVYNPKCLRELQFRDCDLVEDFLEDWRHLSSDLATLLIEDDTPRLYDSSRLTASLRNCDILENLCLQINLAQVNPGQDLLQVPGALQSLLEPFRDLTRLLLRFGAQEFQPQMIDLILGTYCKNLTHFGIQEPVRQHSPMAQGYFTPQWTQSMKEISTSVRNSGVTHFQLILNHPQQCKEDQFRSWDKDRYRIIAQWLFDHMEVQEVSINKRTTRYMLGKPLPLARSFVLDAQQKAKDQEVEDWALSGGCRWLTESMRRDLVPDDDSEY